MHCVLVHTVQFHEKVICIDDGGGGGYNSFEVINVHVPRSVCNYLLVERKNVE